MIDEHRKAKRRVTLGGDKAFDVTAFVRDLRDRMVTPHMARHDFVTKTGKRRGTKIDARTTRHPGYAVSQRRRKRIEEVFGWAKVQAGQAKTRFRGTRASRGSLCPGAGRLQPHPTTEAPGGGPDMTGGVECTVIGKWRIVEADLWDRDYLDLVEPAHITFDGTGHGEFAFGAVNGGLDCEYSRRIIFFTWQGFDEMDEVGGDGSAEINDDGTLEVEIRFHLGDEAELKARRW